MTFTADDYDVLIAAAEAYPPGYGFVYAVDGGRAAEVCPVNLPGYLEKHPNALC
jgi:hypothetical protein